MALIPLALRGVRYTPSSAHDLLRRNLLVIELAPSYLALTTRWLPTGTPGPAAVGEHIAATGVGRWWADRSARPRAIAASCAGNVVLRGAADALAPEALAPLAGTRIDAPAGFLPALGAAFERLTPRERMIWTLQAEPQRPPVPRNVAIRRLEPADTDAVLALGPDASWLSAGWGGPRGLAASWRSPAPSSAAPATRTSPSTRCPNAGATTSPWPASRPCAPTSPRAVTSPPGTVRSASMCSTRSAARSYTSG